MKRIRPSSKREPTIALINIVFLMLVFFMVAGTLTQPIEGDLTLVRTADLDGRAPPDALVVHRDGRLSYRGQSIADPEAYWSNATDGVARIVPDQNLDAAELIRVARSLRIAGAESVHIVTERALE
ncbi:ExbD/TolR family protein [Marivita sp. S0852]|uniref:ExbD/TolR family protein n=1 Tax=Marivita sp. S0852 TaxID=3373893 RepID=UPI003981E843